MWVWVLLGIGGPTASGWGWSWWWRGVVLVGGVVVRRLYAILDLVMIRLRLEMVLVLDWTSYDSSGMVVRMGG